MTWFGKQNVKIYIFRGFPGGAVVENLPANAGDTGSSPGLGRSHMLRSNWAREPQLLSLRVWSLCSATGEAAMVRGPRTVMKSGPHLPQLEKALAQKRRPNTAVNKLKEKKNIYIYIFNNATQSYNVRLWKTYAHIFAIGLYLAGRSDDGISLASHSFSYTGLEWIKPLWII